MIRRMAHLPQIGLGDIKHAQLSKEAVSEYGMRRYLPVKLIDGFAHPTFKGSSRITSIGHADGIIVIKEEETQVKGEVKVQMLRASF